MKILLATILALTIGCTQEPEKVEPKEPPVQTHPLRRMKPKRMYASSKKIIVAVIDTGLGLSSAHADQIPTSKLCDTGHKSFVKNETYWNFKGIKDPIPADSQGHGTNIAGLIYDNAGNANYCMVIIKYWSPATGLDDESYQNTIRSIRHAIDVGASYINYSGGGPDLMEDEAALVKEFLDKGGIFVAAAGNDGNDLAKKAYYPAMDDDRVIVVGNLNRLQMRAESSNYGDRVNAWELGTNQKGFGVYMTGTSQATAVHTGKLLNNQK